MSGVRNVPLVIMGWRRLTKGSGQTFACEVCKKRVKQCLDVTRQDDQWDTVVGFCMEHVHVVELLLRLNFIDRVSVKLYRREMGREWNEIYED